jgi:hypothetical protein
VQSALGLDRGILAIWVGELAVADDVVEDDQAAGPGVREGPGEVVRAVDLVGIDEGEVEGTGALGLQLWQQLEGGADPQIDEIAEAGGGDVLAGDVG